MRKKHHPERSIVSSKHVWPGIFSFFLSLRVFTNRSSSIIRSSCSFQCLLYIYQVSPFLGFETFYEYTTSQNTHHFLFRSKNTSRSADICFVGLQWQGVLVVKSFFFGGVKLVEKIGTWAGMSQVIFLKGLKSFACSL